MKVSVILLAGGVGTRIGQSVPKQFLSIAGKPMIMHSLDRFEKIKEIDEIIIPCVKGYEEKIKQYQDNYSLNKKIVIVNGGATRQESVYNALQYVRNDVVMIHEAARPFVRTKEFQELVDCKYKNVLYGYNIPFTVLKGVDKVDGIIDRSSIVNVQLPQKFDTNTLKSAYDIAIKNNKKYTEDASVVYDCLGEEVNIIRGSKYNLKITDDIDLLLAELIYKEYVLGGKFNE